MKKNILLFLITFLFVMQACKKSEKADLVVLNADIITVDDAKPYASAMAIKGDKILAIGSEKEIKKFISDNTEIIDAQGACITPGFNDAHLHISPLYAENHILGTVSLMPPRVSSMDTLIALLKRKAEITPDGLWVTGSRYDDMILGAHPTKADLDKISDKHPVVVRHSSGHVSVVNSYALKMAGITRNTLDPPGGAFVRDAKGEPNGICHESAGGVIRKAGPKMPEPNDEEELNAFIHCLYNFAAKGITSAGDAGMSPKKLKLFESAYKKNLPVRINMMLSNSFLNLADSIKIDSTIDPNYLRLKTIKVFQGNSLSGRTCWLNQPYEIINPKTGKKDYYGIPPARSQESLDSLFKAIHDAGYQIAVHANGEREINMCLNSIEKALKENPRTDHRHRIEHCSVVDDTILNRIKTLGVVIVPHSYIYEHGSKMEEYGDYRWDRMHPNGSALKAGIPVAGSSDYGVSQAWPMLRIMSLATRKSREGKIYGASQIISVHDAIKIWTMGGAFVTFEENIKGSLSPNKLADFVFLSKNPEKVPVDSIMHIQVLKTFVGGKKVFEL